MKKIIAVSITALLLVGILRLPFGVQPAKSTPRTYTDIASLPPIDWTHYHNYTEVVTILFALNATHPNIVDVFSIGKSWQNRDIYCVRLTNESDQSSKPEVLFMSYHHAREPISAELSLYFVIYAATNYGSNATVTSLFNKSIIYVVVALNVDGFSLYKVNDYQRKNAHPIDEDNDGLVDEDPPEDQDGDGLIEELWNMTNGEFIRWEGIDNDGDGLYGEDWVGGVDLNRNYNYAWEGGNTDPRAEDYGGPASFSEPETRAIRDLVQAHNFKYGIDFHSGAELILYPWGFTHNSPPDQAKFIQISQDLSSLTGGTQYMQSIDLYPTYGASDDWLYGAKGVLALTCEIFTNDTWPRFTHAGPYPNTLWLGGLKYMFNPFPSAIENTMQRWLPVFFYITNRAISEATVTHDVAVTNVKSEKTVIGQGYAMSLNVFVRNEGSFSETFNVTVYANTTTVAKFVNVNLQSGAFTTLTATWNTVGFSKGNYTISANATQVPYETHIADNTCTYGVVKVTIPGDVNGDFHVDIKDASLVGVNWQKHVPPASANVDLNGDGSINIMDATIIGVNWQKP